jgi:hypothetical protein
MMPADLLLGEQRALAFDATGPPCLDALSEYRRADAAETREWSLGASHLLFLHLAGCFVVEIYDSRLYANSVVADGMGITHLRDG